MTDKNKKIIRLYEFFLTRFFMGIIVILFVLTLLRLSWCPWYMCLIGECITLFAWTCMYIDYRKYKKSVDKQ